MGPLGISNSQLPCSHVPCQLREGHGKSRRPWMVAPVQARFVDQRQVRGNGPHQLCRIHLHGGLLVTVQLLILQTECLNAPLACQQHAILVPTCRPATLQQQALC